MIGKAIISNDSGELNDYIVMIQSAFTKATDICQRLLSIQPVDVVFYADKNECIPEISIGGYTVNSKIIKIALDPTGNIDENELIYTICHGLYHAKRYTGPGYGKTLFDALIFEGLAICFEDEISDGKAFMVRHVNSQINNAGLVKKLEPLFKTTGFNYHEIFTFGNITLPRWAGNIVGYYLVRNYMAKVKKPASQLVKIKASKIAKSLK